MKCKILYPDHISSRLSHLSFVVMIFQNAWKSFASLWCWNQRWFWYLQLVLTQQKNTPVHFCFALPSFCQLRMWYEIRPFCVALENLQIHPQFTSLTPLLTDPLNLSSVPASRNQYPSYTRPLRVPDALFTSQCYFLLFAGMAYPMFEVQILPLLSPIPSSWWHFPWYLLSLLSLLEVILLILNSWNILSLSRWQIDALYLSLSFKMHFSSGCFLLLFKYF